MASGKYLFTSEAVSMGHPDKLADQISDGVLDALFAQDPNSRVACETMVTTGVVVIAGEISTDATVDMQSIVRDVIREVGYTDSTMGISADHCAVMVAIDEQSPDIAMGVDDDAATGKDVGAGDQGLMFGYACNDTPELMPLPIALSHRILNRLTEARQNGEVDWLRPDSKSQVTVEFDGTTPVRIDTVVVSTQHAPDVTNEEIRDFIVEKIIKPELPSGLAGGDITYHINPTGRFVVGGPHGDCGLTGRKIIVDTYGGWGRHGGGAFSGKDPHQGRPQRCLHGALRGEEYRRGRVGRSLRSAACLRNWRFGAGQYLHRHRRHRQSRRRRDLRSGQESLPAQSCGHHQALGPPTSDLPQDGGGRPLWTERT